MTASTPLQGLLCDHFDLHEKAFSIAPDPRFLFMSRQHQEAWAHLRFGLQGEGGIVLLTGEVGTGKTTICRHLLAELTIEDETSIDLAYILNPRLTAPELLLTICEELGVNVDATASIKHLIDRLNHHLLARHALGHNTVVMIDEAQNLAIEVLEQLRLLTNLETSERKLLQVLLVGQPELKQQLQRRELRQLAQRITARFHLQAMSLQETGACIRHRLHVAGRNSPLFTPLAIWLIHRHSGGIPRLINLICERALLGAYTKEKARVGLRTVNQAASEVLDIPQRSRTIPWLITSLLALVVVWAFIPMQLLNPSGWPVMLTQSQPTLLEQKNSIAIQPVMVETLPIKEAKIEVVVPPEPASQMQLMVEASPEHALQTLISLWPEGQQLDTKHNCNKLAQTSGLQCFRQRATLALLRDFNRPAIVRLVGETEDIYVVLRGLDATKAKLQLGNQQWELSLEEFSQRWYSDVTLLWQATTDYAGPLHRGDQGAMIPRLIRQLNLVYGVAIVGAESSSVDSLLQARIRQFQRDQGLKSDGIAGALTLIRLNDAAAEAGPRLRVIVSREL